MHFLPLNGLTTRTNYLNHHNNDIIIIIYLNNVKNRYNIMIPPSSLKDNNVGILVYIGEPLTHI